VRQLSDGELDRLRGELDRDGYTTIRTVVSKDKLSSFTAELARAYERDGGFTGGGSLSGHLNCFPGESARFIMNELEDKGICEAVRTIRCGLPNEVRATINYNLPGSVAQHYHMDGAYQDNFLICNVAMVDTHVTNGAIDLLPSTNRQFYPFWKYAIQRKYRLSRRVPMEQGDVLLRKSTLWHRGTPNTSTVARPMMAITFGEVSAPQGDPFLGAVDFYANWYATSPFGRLRERVEVAAPITRSTYRFFRSIIGHGGYS
jgi:ectoine hydroxylase-related dioxygenase (phytanoyl-CoA dioxygenase family)